MTVITYDLAIIGSGSAGFAAAIAARSGGENVVMIERDTTGGTCVNIGCVPSKALLAAAEAHHGAHIASRFPGISATSDPLDFTALIDGKDMLVGKLRTEKYIDLAAEYGWEIIHGNATFTAGPTLTVTPDEGGERRIKASHYLVATGAAPWVPPIDGLADAGYLTSTTAMELNHLPESMIVIGGNAVGLEQAQLFARLGTQVTIVEALDRLAPFEEPEISHVIEEAFRDEGIHVRTGVTLTAVRRAPQTQGSTSQKLGRPTTYILATAEGVELRAEQLLVATGRRPVTGNLKLDAVGVETGAHGEIIVDDHLRTTNEHIWAAGDVTGHPQFVYVAAAQGTLAAENALFHASHTLDYTTLPRVTFTSPAIASVGMTDSQVMEAGMRCDCRTLPLSHVPRALVNRDTRGVVKLVAEAGTGRLLGVHVVSDNAGDLITAGSYALSAGLTVEQIGRMWSPYLTMAESLKLCAQTYSVDVTKLSCCAG